MSSSDTAAAAGNGRPNPAAGSGEREVKRSRIAESSEDGAQNVEAVASPAEEPGASLHLTPDVWALVMPSLSFKDAVRCTGINKMFLKDVAPRVKEITVMFSDEMKQLKSARRFSGVEKVTIACLFADKGGLGRDGFGRYSEDYFNSDGFSLVDSAVTSRAVPFVSSFSSLKEIRFGLFRHGGTILPISDIRWDDRMDDELGINHPLLQGLHLSFCGAYELGLISSVVKISGFSFHCDSDAVIDEGCSYCQRFVECFPLKEVVFSKERWCCMSIEKQFVVVAKRDGGRELLESNPRRAF